MPARKIKWPTDQELVEIASGKTSKAEVARHFGIKPGTLNMRLHSEKELGDRIAAALALREGEGPTTEEMLRQEIRELRASLRKRRKSGVLIEKVAQAVTDSIESRGVPEFKRPPKRRTKKQEKAHELVLLWSDTHYGEVVSHEETNGLNYYDMETCWKRHQQIRRAVLSFAEHRPYPVYKLHVLMLGDMLSGSIHDELKETNEVPLAEASVDFAERGSEWLESFSDAFDEIEVTGVVGNHPRFDAKMRAKGGFDNADWMSYHHMKSLLRKHPGITFDIPRANSHIHQVLGRNILLTHGDGIQSSMVGVPWGGVIRRANTLHAQYSAQGTPISLYCFGHFHQRALVNGPAGSKIALNGSTKGVDEYGLKRFGGGESAGQMLLTFHPTRGLTDMSLIDCQEVEE